MFYIVGKEVIDALHKATKRAVNSQLNFDPNKIAFDNNQTIIPNLTIAIEMMEYIL